MTNVTVGFDLTPLTLIIDKILPSRKTPSGVTMTRKYMQIRSSLEDVGLIEPLSVGPPDSKSGQHVLLDGHIRLMVLRELGYIEVPCIIATDDESYTYNTRINRLSTIQEHNMIKRAIERGVAPDRLAKALNLDKNSILKKVSMLQGICPEAIELLKNRQFSPKLFPVLKKMKPTRQIECVELMILANTITAKYAEAMLAATPESLLIEERKKTNKLKGLSSEQMAKMEREMSNLQGKYKMVEETYGTNTLNLVLAQTYLAKLLKNSAVVRYLSQHQQDVLAEFEVIVQTSSIDQ